jgi:hypothetical protein
MQNANTLFAVMRTCGEKGQPVKRLYRMLFNRELYLQAYAKLYSNEGAMTPGVTPETVDEMSLKKIDNIIESIKFERYRWTPVRRTYIKKEMGNYAHWVCQHGATSYCKKLSAPSGRILRTTV